MAPQPQQTSATAHVCTPTSGRLFITDKDTMLRAVSTFGPPQDINRDIRGRRLLGSTVRAVQVLSRWFERL
jgi:hypothetical protein